MSTHTRRTLLAGLGTGLVAALMPSPASAAKDTTAPTAPTNLRVETVSHTWVRLAWDPSTDNAGAPMYEGRLHAPEFPNGSRTFDTALGFGGLQAGTTYVASVFAVDLAGNQSAAVPIEFSTLARSGPPPSTPANLRAVYANGVLSSIAWDPSSHSSPVSYQLYSGPDSLFATWGTSVSAFELIHHAYVDPGSTHTFTVQAIGAGNYLSEHSQPLTATLPVNPPRP
jgi:hypothetical protein